MVDLALTTVLDVYQTKQIFARVDPSNTVSAKLLTRRGFDHYTLG